MFNRMFFYTSLVSASYLLLSNTDTDGEFDWDTRLKCDFILNHFWNLYKEIFSEKFENYYEHAGYRSYDFTNKEFFDDYDAKDKLREYLIELIIEILSIADARVMVHNNEIEKSTQAFNEKIRERRPIRKHEITMDCFRKANLRAKRLTNNKRSIENVLDLILSDIKDSLKKDCYRLLVERLFNSGGFGKSINNDFTDFSNLILLESFNPGEAVYLTYEKSWLSFLESHKDNPFVIDTITFCKKYEVGTS